VSGLRIHVQVGSLSLLHLLVDPLRYSLRSLPGTSSAKSLQIR